MKIKITLPLLTFLTFIFSCFEINAQTGGCDITGPSSGNYTFQSNNKVCFYNNSTLGDVTFQNGTKIYIAPNVTVIIQNNVTSSGTINMEIDGTLQFTQSVTINANVNLNIGTKGILKAGSSGGTDFTLNGDGTNTIINNGQFTVGVLGLQNSNGTYTFDSSTNAIINIKSNINIGGKSFFRNQGKLLIGNSYNCNSKSVFVNCGEMVSSAGFNLSGGKVINTGKFTVSSSRIDFGSSTARFENYGSVNVQGSMNLGGSGCVYYNEGTTVVSDNFQNDGNIEGPAVGSGKLGYITWKGKAAMNSGKIGPNLNLINSNGTSSKLGMFNSHNEMDFLSGVVYNCSNCPAPQVNSGVICREPDGTTPCNIATPTISTTAASCTQPSSLLISNYDSSVSYTITPSGPTVVSGGGISGMTVGQSYTLKASKNSCNSSDVLISINKLSGTDTDGDGVLDQCEFDETCNVYTTVLAEPTDKLVSDLNRNGKGLFPVKPFGPATLPNGGVNVEVIKGFKSTLTYPSPQWRLYQPNAITGTIVIKGVPTEFKTKYLDLVYASENNLERTVKLDYGVTANSLNTATHKYRYIVGIAGLSDPNVAGTVTSTVPLEVIGNFDAFKNGKYSYFNDKTPPVAGETGYVFQSNPKTATNVAPPNGYTFFYLPENISSFELETKGNDQYGFIFGTLTTTVSPTPAAPTSGGNQTVCWNGNANHTLTATATAPQGQIVTWYESATGGTPTTPTLVGIGTKTYYAQSSNPNGTCSSLTRTAVTLTINPTPAAPISGGNQIVCSDGTTTQTLTATATGAEGSIITWYTEETGGTLVTNPTQVGVGTTTYYAQNSNGTCTSLTRTAVTLTIHPAAGIPTASNVEYCEGTTAQPLTATATNPSYTLYYYTSENSAPQSSITPVTTTPGEFTYYVAEGINNSCIGTKKAITVTVHPKSIITTQPINQSITYGDNTSFTVSATNVTSYQWQVNTGSGFVTITNDSFYSNATTATLNITRPTVGMSSYTYRAILNGRCTETETQTVKVTVSPKAVTVKADDKTKVYGDENPALTAVVTGAVNNDVINYSLSTTATQFSPVDTYPIVVTLGNNPNYIVTKVDGTLTVTPKELNVVVTADDKTKVYGDENPALTAVVTGAVNNDVINYSLSTTATQFSPVDTYPIVVTLGNNPNYIVTKVDGTLTVTPKELNVVVTADDKTKVYGDENPALTAVVTGAVNNDVINYSLSTTATQFSPVDTYPIVVTLGNNPNYIVTKVDGTLTVTPKELNVVVTADDKTKVYGDENPALTAVVTGAVNGDTINYTLATTATQFSNVGSYPIEVTLGNNPNYIVTKVDGTLIVTPKELNVVVTADDKTKVYGDENPALTAVVTGAVNNDVINYTLATTATQFSNVGSYPIVVTLGNNPNYIVTKVDDTLTVTPKELNVVVTADDKTKVYGDENPALTAVVTGAVNNDVINYSLSTTATQFSPVDTYPIVVTLGNNPNYIVTKVDGTLTVTPKELNVVVTADDKTKVYGDENPALTAVVTGAVNNDVINYSLSTTATQFSPVDTYPIVVTLGNNPNYIVTKVDGTLTVTPKELNVVVTADDKTKVYGDENPALTAVVTGAVNNDVINYTLATTATQFSPVDTYPIVVTLGNNPNYIVNKVDGTLTVTPKELNVVVTADDKTKVYGDENPALTAVVTGAVNNDVINYTLATTTTQFSNVGSYPIEVTLGNNPNYIVTKVDGTLTVTPKELNVVVTADDKTKVYGDENPALTAVVTGAVNGDTINYTLATTATQFSNVGSYPIVVTLGNNPNYIVTKVDGTLTVTPKELNVVVTADDKTKVYGDENPALTAVVTGAVNGDTINYTLATTATQFSNVGSYPIEVTLGNNPNYIVTKVDGTLTVTPKELNVVVTADDKTKVYGDENPALTAVVTGAVNGDTINYTLATTATQFSNVGSYPIVVTLGNNPNYIVNKVDGTLTVTPKELNVVVTADDKTKVYGDENPALTAVVTGAVNGDTINYTLATTATQFSNVGSYPIVVTLGNNPNYIVNKVDGTLTVTSSAINANDDVTGPINGIQGGNAGINILSNDYLNGSIVNPLEITTSFVSSNNSGITLVGTDIVVAAGTPAGDYELVYKICENINLTTNCDQATVKISIYTPSLSITKDGNYLDTNNDGKTNIGDQIKYTFTVKNTGGSKLTNITITDNKVTVLGGPIDLNIDESDTTTFSAIYNITQEDINKGVVYNLAIAKGTPPVGDPITATSTDPTPCTTCPKDPVCTDCTITEVPQNPGIAITKDGTYVDANNDGKTNIGDVVSYKFVITNTGNVTLTNVTVADDNATVTGGPIATLAPGATDATTFTASHTITQEDINKGIVYNLATATAKDPKDNPVTATSTDPTPCTTCPKDPVCTDCTITELPQNPGIAITKDGIYVDANNDGKTNIGDVVSYKFVITNTGNVTLTNVTVADDNATVTGGPIATLAPGATDATTFTASHTITQEDINKGIVYNLATATAKDPKDNPVTATSTDPTPCTTCPKDPVCTDCTITEVPQNAELTVNKTATVTSNNTQTDVYSFVGDIINYTINVINTGNVTINNIIVKDPLTGLDTTNQSFSLLPGENKEFTQNLTVTLADLNNESITNIATASGLTPNNNPVEAEDTVIVERAGVLGCGTIDVHNAFTPNGDGTNDNFVIDNIDDTICYPENTVEIYNRWGILVYETKGYDNVNNAFKGYSEGRVTVDKSAGLPAGTYFYILNYTAVGLQGEIIPNKKQGYLYLTR